MPRSENLFGIFQTSVFRGSNPNMARGALFTLSIFIHVFITLNDLWSIGLFTIVSFFNKTKQACHWNVSLLKIYCSWLDCYYCVVKYALFYHSIPSKSFPCDTSNIFSFGFRSFSEGSTMVFVFFRTEHVNTSQNLGNIFVQIVILEHTADIFLLRHL